MSLVKYLKENKNTICFFLLIVGTVDFILITSRNFKAAVYEVLYLNLLIIVFATIFLIYNYVIWKNKYKDLVEALIKGDKIDYVLRESNCFYNNLLGEVIKFKNYENEKLVKELKCNIDELNDYITRWIHDIKIPVAVCELILEDVEDYKIQNELEKELEKIKFLTNQVLYISRSTNYEEDLTIKSINLSSSVKQAIKRNSTLLISKNIDISIGNLDYEVLSDEKWIAYVLDQLLNNSYKYINQNGKIKISASVDNNSNVVLSFCDNGIGIMKQDIERIFDKSFTGKNKIDSYKSTGMGLYIVKKMLNKLGHKIIVESEENEFTEFKIVFYRINDYKYNITKM